MTGSPASAVIPVSAADLVLLSHVIAEAFHPMARPPSTIPGRGSRAVIEATAAPTPAQPPYRTEPAMAERVLFIAPHPDDEVLGCGGTIAKLAAAGHEIRIAYLTSGEQGSADIPAAELGVLREREARAAASVLGVSPEHLEFLRISDGRISPHDPAQAGAVIRLLRQLRPTLLYLPHERDGSWDHRAAHDVVMRAAAMAGSGNFPGLGGAWWVPTVLGYEVWAPISAPAYLEDTGEYTAVKLAALGCYSSQAGKGCAQADHVGPAGLALSAFRGAVTTGGHREAFAVLRLGQVIA